MEPDALALGIDLGTSKVAVSLLDGDGVQVHTAAMAHAADLVTPATRAEQDAELLLRAAINLVRGLSAELRARVAVIGFTGQMHGIVLHDAAGRARSPLITWQDRRILDDAESTAIFGDDLRAGWGLTTLAWWARRGELTGDLRAATIHGLLAARCGGLARSPIDPTDHAAWGGDAGLEKASDVPASVLPLSVDHGACVGHLCLGAATALGLNPGIPLAAPLGDNQASLRATLTDPEHELAFTLGTGSQLSAVIPRTMTMRLGAGCERRPFDASHDALVAAPLCGGAAWRWLAQTAANWSADLGMTPPSLHDIFARLDVLGLAATDRLEFHPHLAGERHDPELRGTLGGLAFDNGSLGEVARALARGLAATARDLLPIAARAGRLRVAVSGNALRRSSLLRAMTESELELPVVLGNRIEEAACGAALVGLGLIVPEQPRIGAAPPG